MLPPETSDALLIAWVVTGGMYVGGFMGVNSVTNHFPPPVALAVALLTSPVWLVAMCYFIARLMAKDLEEIKPYSLNHGRNPERRITKLPTPPPKRPPPHTEKVR